MNKFLSFLYNYDFKTVNQKERHFYSLCDLDQ